MSVTGPRSGPPLGAGPAPAEARTRDQTRELMIENELRSENRRNRSHVDMPPIGAYGQALEPFRAVNQSVGPFVGNFRLQVRIADLALLHLILGEVGGWIGNPREALG